MKKLLLTNIAIFLIVNALSQAYIPFIEKTRLKRKIVKLFHCCYCI